jgi:hypothetical protein
MDCHMTEVEELRAEFKALQFVFAGHAVLVCRALARGVLPSIAKQMSSEELMIEETKLARAGNDDVDLVSDWSRQAHGQSLTIEGEYDNGGDGTESNA